MCYFETSDCCPTKLYLRTHKPRRDLLVGLGIKTSFLKFQPRRLASQEKRDREGGSGSGRGGGGDGVDRNVGFSSSKLKSMHLLPQTREEGRVGVGGGWGG